MSLSTSTIEDKKLATDYVYAFLECQEEPCDFLLSDTLFAKVYRNGQLDFEGNKDAFLSYLREGVFQSLKDARIRELTVTSPGGSNTQIQLNTYQQHEERSGNVEDTIAVTVTAGKIVRLTHNYFPSPAD